MRSLAEGSVNVCSRDAAVRSQALRWVPGFVRLCPSHRVPLLQPQLPHRYSGVIIPTSWDRREHQMAYNLQARRPEPGTCWLSSLLLSVYFMPCPCSVLEASWHFLGDMKCSETLAWVSASRSLMSWPLGWQSPVPTATQSPHGEAAWPLSASLTPRCPCLRQGQSHTDSWRRLALRSGATSDHVWGRWLISEMIHVLRGRRQTLQVSSQGTGQPGSPHWRG